MRTFLITLVVVTVGLVAVPALADDGGRPFTTALTGAAEAPGPGDPNASGTASLRLNPGQGEVCFDLSWADIDGEVFAAHIHVAPAGSPGPIVVPLFTGSFVGTGNLSDCVEGVDRGLIRVIIQNPEAYYVNVHSRPNFPGGAIRGQLSR
ncbi:MAG: CHRD domain-containing protein [Gaiellaceae bacterium]